MADALNCVLCESIQLDKCKPVVAQILGAWKHFRQPAEVKQFLARCQKMLVALGFRVHVPVATLTGNP